MDNLILYDTDPDDPFLVAEAAATVVLLTLDTGNAIASVALGVDEVHQLRDWLNEWIRRNTDADWPIRHTEV
jgi:transposase-like protein